MDPAVVGQRPSWKASVAVQEMQVRGMLCIPQRYYMRTGRCSRANLRRRGGLPAADPQVRQKKKTPTPSHILTSLPAFHQLLYSLVPYQFSVVDA